VTNTSPSSVVFNFEEIQQRLTDGELFVQGTWLASSIRRAGYDLRVGDEAIVVPKAPGDNQDVLSYPRGKKRTQDIVLAPGQVAFLSTYLIKKSGATPPRALRWCGPQPRVG